MFSNRAGRVRIVAFAQHRVLPYCPKNFGKKDLIRGFIQGAAAAFSLFAFHQAQIPEIAQFFAHYRRVQVYAARNVF